MSRRQSQRGDNDDLGFWITVKWGANVIRPQVWDCDRDGGAGLGSQAERSLQATGIGSMGQCPYDSQPQVVPQAAMCDEPQAAVWWSKDPLQSKEIGDWRSTT